jgi:hypothetical protein
VNIDKAKINIQRGGEFFIYSLWLQSQMADLIILNRYPKIVSDFVGRPERVPDLMSQERAVYWQFDFHRIKTDFTDTFLISNLHKTDLEAVYHIRNAIAHSQISIGREYFLYRPARGETQEQNIISSLELSSVEDQSNPMMLKLSFYNDDQYMKDFSRIKRLDEDCFKGIAGTIGIPHSRIR